jgi:molybdenum cofactor guanylyltransferase
MSIKSIGENLPRIVKVKNRDARTILVSIIHEGVLLMPLGPNHTRKLNDFSVIILAGGKSQRMGSDKAFLTYQGKPFVQLIGEEMIEISNDVVVVIGKKSEDAFKTFLDQSIRILRDDYEFGNPIGGLLTGFSHAKHRYGAVIACDSPLVKGKVIEFLRVSVRKHSAAIPIWENDAIEPLCAVYDLEEARTAIAKELRLGRMGPKNMVAQLERVNYVSVLKIREIDPLLESLANINSMEDYIRLQNGITHPIAKSR